MLIQSIASNIAKPFEALPWEAPWIAPSREFITQTNGLRGVYFRRDFHLSQKYPKAVLSVIGLGHFRLFVNGHTVGDAPFYQPWSQYNRRIYVTQFSVGPYLKEGENVIGISVGSSFWHETTLPGGRYFKGDSVNDSSNGEPILASAVLFSSIKPRAKPILSTGSEWQWCRSPVVFTHEMGGEDFDARQDQVGWNRPGFIGENWKPARVASAPGAEISPVFWPELRVTNTFDPVQTLYQPEGSYTYVFPQNASAILRYTVQGQPGQSITFTPSETMAAGGKVEQLNLSGRHMTYQYTIGSNQPETHQNQFQYFGFQFVKVQGAVPRGVPNPNHLPVLESIQELHLQTDNVPVGKFETSHPILNGTDRIINWAMRSNMSYVLTDCPTREKMGWLECSYLLAPSLFYQWNCAEWYQKIAVDIADTQLENGLVRTTAPAYLQLPPSNPFAFTVEWGAAAVLAPWEAYKWYGNLDDLKQDLTTMRKFVDYVETQSPDGIAPGGLGDWYDYKQGHDPGESLYTPTDLSATATYARCVRAVAAACQIAGDHLAEKHYEALFQSIKVAFWKKFYNPAKGELENSGSVQTAHAMALCCGLVPPEFHERILNAIVKELESNGYQQTSGDIGHVYLIRALAEAGRSDVLFHVYEREGMGSYGGILKKGLTTLPESWDARSIGSNSLNHAMLGHVIEWFYGYIGGIRQVPGSVGWAKILLSPNLGNLSFANVQFKSPKGLIESSWKVKGQGFEWDVLIPAGTTAECIFPVGTRDFQVDGRPVPGTNGPIQLNAGPHHLSASGAP